VPSKEGPPTLADVAASAGVSIATVSKVLNGRADVGPETRARVQSILQQQDYVGRRLEPVEHSLTGATIELVFHGQLSSYSVEVLQGVVEAATEAGVTVAVSVRPRQRRPGRHRKSARVHLVIDDPRVGVLHHIPTPHRRWTHRGNQRLSYLAQQEIAGQRVIAGVER
jgi:LacI family transcriptional regulator, galactose operon repressor